MALWNDTFDRPGPARGDRGVRGEGFRRLVEDASGFVEGVLCLSVAERRQFAVVFGRDIPSMSGAHEAALCWLASEDDLQVATSLQAALLRAPRACVQGETLWLVHGKGDALSVRESGVAYHPQPPSNLRFEASKSDLRDEAARRMWAHRRDLPKAASRFAGFFD
ncbi:MAG: hypothetical protein AB8H86_14145 [Polyangiales bacterium]